jgi:hypothetical protein
MNYELPIPIAPHRQYPDDYECLCKFCKNPSKYTYIDMGSYVWYKCTLCEIRVWCYFDICSLYGDRIPVNVCFYCRIPYYEAGYNSSQIYKKIKDPNYEPPAYEYVLK